jgi:hypothetical protein
VNLVRGLLGCLTVLVRRKVFKDAELVVLRHENAVLRPSADRENGESRADWGSRVRT